MIAVLNKSTDAVCPSTPLPYVDAASSLQDETPPPPPLHSSPFHLLRQVSFSHPFNLDGSFHTSVCSLPRQHNEHQVCRPVSHARPLSAAELTAGGRAFCQQSPRWLNASFLRFLPFFPLHPAALLSPDISLSLSLTHFSDVTKVICCVLSANASLILCTYSRRRPVSLPANSAIKS